jgi:hypothetical protein
VESKSTLAEWLIGALVRSGDVAVERHADVEHELGHGCVLSGFVDVAIVQVRITMPVGSIVASNSPRLARAGRAFRKRA